MFDFLKKKEVPKYDVTNLTVNDLAVGFIFDYEAKSWVVKEAYEYDWGSNNFSKEYKVDAGDDVAFLSVENAGDIKLSMSKEIKTRLIDEDVLDELKKYNKPPRQIHYEKEVYYLESDSAGYYNEVGADDDAEELVAYEYFNENGKKLVSITQWDEYNIETAAGDIIQLHHITDILPGG